MILRSEEVVAELGKIVMRLGVFVYDYNNASSNSGLFQVLNEISQVYTPNLMAIFTKMTDNLPQPYNDTHQVYINTP